MGTSTQTAVVDAKGVNQGREARADGVRWEPSTQTVASTVSLWKSRVSRGEDVGWGAGTDENFEASPTPGGMTPGMWGDDGGGERRERFAFESSDVSLSLMDTVVTW